MNIKTKAEAIRVAVGVIIRDNQVCISLRPDHLHKGGYWEFPGGKIHEGESAESALARELREELGIEICATSPLIEIDWSYPEKKVRLEVFLVTDFSGEARGMEDQEVRWVAISDLASYTFPEANSAIVDVLIR